MNFADAGSWLMTCLYLSIKLSLASCIFWSNSFMKASTSPSASIASVGRIIVVGAMFPRPSLVCGLTPGSAFISAPL